MSDYVRVPYWIELGAARIEDYAEILRAEWDEMTVDARTNRVRDVVNEAVANEVNAGFELDRAVVPVDTEETE